MDLYIAFWDKNFWLPTGYSWDDLDPQKTNKPFPNSGDLWVYPFIFAGFCVFLKYCILIPFVFVPLGKRLKIRSQPYRHPPHNSILDQVYKKFRSRAPHPVIEEHAKKLGWTNRQVDRWLRQKTVSQQATTMEKYIDCAWQLVYYVGFCITGIVVLHDKPWLYDVRHCWYSFPMQFPQSELWWYYMVALGFYWCQTATHFMQPRRHDSAHMLCHHIVTILLTSLSWVCNFVRIGSLILFLHECADIPLLIAKICGYCKRPSLMDKWFVVFVILWIVTRLGIFPLRLIRSTLFEAHVQEDKFYPVYYLFNGLILSIFFMHLIWTYNILQVIARKFSSDHISDVRSSASEISSDDVAYPATKKKE
ncbi:ceramide synthase 6-like [Hyalella azteca]|uniref:Ceramide synthase 6-like n=1 Tax=Hyalella azteca TaxID=294128 RepID=A0A8B7NR98_HYAAZ|nr:ceramide synthase 6-like [Hyalella azteca]